jgi:hypothetical protein
MNYFTLSRNPLKGRMPAAAPLLRRARLLLEGSLCGVAFVGVFASIYGLNNRSDWDIIGAALGAATVASAIALRKTH